MNQLEINFPKVRISKKARIDLEKLVRIERKERGSNVSMGDVVSELIVARLRSKLNGNGAHWVGDRQGALDLPKPSEPGLEPGTRSAEVKA